MIHCSCRVPVTLSQRAACSWAHQGMKLLDQRKNSGWCCLIPEGILCVYTEWGCFSVHGRGTWAVGASTINVIIGLPLLGDLVGMDEYDQHCNQTDERHQHCCAQSCIDVRDKAPKADGQKGEWLIWPQSVKDEHDEDKRKGYGCAKRKTYWKATCLELNFNRH